MKKEDYKLSDIFENEILNQLYETSGDGFRGMYIQIYGEPEEIKETRKSREELENFINGIVKDEEKQKQFWLKLDRFEGDMSGESCFWNRQYYKLGFLDKLYFKKEIREKNEKFCNKEVRHDVVKDNFCNQYIDSIMQFIEDNRFNVWRKKQEYQDIENKMSEIKNNYPKIRDFIENERVTELTPEELKALIEYMRLDNEIESIEKIETFKLGIKEGSLL